MSKKYYTAKTDIIFKRSICVKPYDYLKQIIEMSINKKILKIENVKVSDEDLYSPYFIKNKILDVTALTNQGKINVEINSNVDTSIRVRNFCYIANIYINETKRGMEYKEDKMFYQINLSWGLGKTLPIKGEYEIADLTSGLKFIENFKIIEFNMDIIDDLWYHGTDEKKEELKYLMALNLDSNNLSKLVKGNKIMEEFKEKVDYLNNDDDVINFLNTREDWEKLDRSVRLEEQEKAINEAVNKAIDKNTKKVTNKVTKEVKLETARNLLNIGVSKEDISKATGLSMDIINSL